MKKLMSNIYINKEIAKLRFTDWYHESYTDEQIIKILDDIPTADVTEVRHGRWEFEDDDYVTWCTKAICSSCKQTVALNADLAQDWGKRLFLKDNLFCPKCGAKMDGGQDDV